MLPRQLVLFACFFDAWSHICCSQNRCAHHRSHELERHDEACIGSPGPGVVHRFALGADRASGTVVIDLPSSSCLVASIFAVANDVRAWCFWGHKLSGQTCFSQDQPRDAVPGSMCDLSSRFPAIAAVVARGVVGPVSNFCCWSHTVLRTTANVANAAFLRDSPCIGWRR